MARFCRSFAFALALLSVGCGSQVTGEPFSEPPAAEPGAIGDFLVARDYASWRSESRIHPGLNDTGRRVFLNERVDPDGSPVGAAAVREIFDGTGPEARMLGWSMLIKVDDNTGSSDDWFFYETFDPDGAEHSVAARGSKGCTFCHDAATDTIQSQLPLR